MWLRCYKLPLKLLTHLKCLGNMHEGCIHSLKTLMINTIGTLSADAYTRILGCKTKEQHNKLVMTDPRLLVVLVIETWDNLNKVKVVNPSSTANDRASPALGSDRITSCRQNESSCIMRCESTSSHSEDRLCGCVSGCTGRNYKLNVTSKSWALVHVKWISASI